MNLTLKKHEESAINEFDQVVVGNSLTKDAWRRLKKNKMAVIGMIVVIVYSLLAAFAMFLPIYPYDQIILDHRHLPPTLTKNAGTLMMEARLKDLYLKAEVPDLVGLVGSDPSLDLCRLLLGDDE